MSQNHLDLMHCVMKFNYQYIYHNKRLEVYHAYARLILESIYGILKECYAGEQTLDNIRRLQDDYPTLGKHFLERMRKFSDIGRHIAKDKFGNSFVNTVIYHIQIQNRVTGRPAIDYITGTDRDTYAEKIF